MHRFTLWAERDFELRCVVLMMPQPTLQHLCFSFVAEGVKGWPTCMLAELRFRMGLQALSRVSTRQSFLSHSQLWESSCCSFLQPGMSISCIVLNHPENTMTGLEPPPCYLASRMQGCATCGPQAACGSGWLECSPTQNRKFT